MKPPILASRAGSGREVAHQKIDDVVIRFAGDSGDGMQLTGTQFTNTSALLGNDLATFPDFPAEIRAPQGTLAGVSAFQVRIADYDIHTPGDAPDMLVAMNPAALKVNLKDLKPSGALIVNLDEFDERNLKKAGFTGNPLEDGSLANFRLFKVEFDDPHSAGARRQRPRRQVAGALQELLRAGNGVLALQPADRRDDRLAGEEVRGQAPARRGQRPGAEGGLQLLRHHRALPYPLRDRAGEAPGRCLPQHHRRHGDGVGLHRGVAQERPAALPGRLPDHSGLRPAARARDVQELRRDHLPGRGRDRRRLRGHRSRLRGRSRDHFDLGSGARPEERGDESRGDGGVAAGGRRRPARRTVDRPADEDRAGRPAAGDVRPQQRVAAAGARGLFAGRLLRSRHRGLPDRDPPHDAGSAALRRLHRQRLRALAPPGSRRSTRLRRSSSAPAPKVSCRICGTPRPWRGPGRSRARPDSSTVSAASRSRTAPATSPTIRRTTTTWSGCGRRRWPGSPT